jgi:UDP-N-acetylglucosamine 2-epimerase (non-hydrolysing)
MGLGKVWLERKPDLVIVFGDVNSTLAAAIAATKLSIPLAHVEAGLRSFDRTMPEEINRVVTDALSDYLFTTEPAANENLAREGIPEEKVFLVGNVMIDTLLAHVWLADRSSILADLGLQPKQYAVLTLHRPSNVDVNGTLQEIMQAVIMLSHHLPVVFPCHPRTEKRLEAVGLAAQTATGDRAIVAQSDTHVSGAQATSVLAAQGRLILIPPQRYIDFLALQKHARFVLTDSGGIQEETTVLGVPCLTLRDNTERPITVQQGTNQVVGTKKENILETAFKILNGDSKVGSVPELWDGRASERIVQTLIRLLSSW